ncbi:response regulator transcription factor [Puniceibacterium confluentis]|uniref:response regulator transcription factor n=1 Tax=Puniceibacterium confluentis TaxID=1958944 RepID=UPI0011B51AF7|nr:response regulator transcription factor [Puniceibacterium confluentis]
MRILVADDHDLVRETIAAYLHGDDIQDVRSVASLDEAIAEVRRSGAFDLVLLDYAMPGMNGLEGLTQMIAANDGHPVAILSGTAKRQVAERALQAGARGFIPKTLGARSLLSAARFMAAGEIYAPVAFLTAEPDEPPTIVLSGRESQVLAGICAGQSNKEIARDHALQEVTVKLYVKTLSRKLGARNRTHAAMLARDLDLI